MHIVIVGGGLVGSTLSSRLSRDGHDVVLIEDDPRKARELGEALDARVIEGSGAAAEILRQADIRQTDLVVATTDRDEINLVVGLLAAGHFDVPSVVIRLRDPGHQEAFDALAAQHPHRQMICIDPRGAAVERILALLEVPGALDVVSFLGGEVIVAGFRIGEGSDFAGFPVSHMHLLFADTPTLVAAIQRRDEWIIPHGAEQIQVGDLAYFVIARNQLDNVLTLVGAPRDPRHRVMIAGATALGLDLARRLESSETQVVLVEENAELAREAADLLAETLVVHGKVTEQAILEEEEIDRISAFVAVTADHETNLVSGLLAKQLGARRAFALVDNPALAHLVAEIGIDAIISPRLLAVSLTMQHIRGSRVRSVAALLEEEIEAVEAEVSDGARLCSRPLAQLDLPRGMLVAALRRGERVLVPRGGDRVAAGDQVLMITSVENVPRVSTYLSP